MPTTSVPVPTDFAFSRKSRRTGPGPIDALMAAAVGNPNLISFAAGLVDYDTLPVDSTRALLDAALADDAGARRALQYGTNAGDARLRELAVERLADLEGQADLPFGADDLVVTTGSQQALYLVSDVLLDPGDIVITAAPCYFVYRGLLESLGADVRTVPVSDAHGFDVDALDRLLGELDASGDLGRVKLVYVQSYFQNPTGLTVSASARPKLVEVVRRHGDAVGRRILLLEDAAYRELGDAAKSLPSLKSYDPDNAVVASCYTFSKPFAPGLKTGYAVLPASLREAVLRQKSNHDFGSPNLCQRLLREALASGAYEQHVACVRAGYAHRRRLMLDALDRHLSDLPVRWTRPAGGLYVYLTLPDDVDSGSASPMFEAAAAQDVLYVPGAYCHANGGGRNEVRLCHATVPLDRIDTGIARFATAVRAGLDQRARGDGLRRSA